MSMQQANGRGTPSPACTAADAPANAALDACKSEMSESQAAAQGVDAAAAAATSVSSASTSASVAALDRPAASLIASTSISARVGTLDLPAGVTACSTAKQQSIPESKTASVANEPCADGDTSPLRTSSSRERKGTRRRKDVSDDRPGETLGAKVSARGGGGCSGRDRHSCWGSS